MAVVTARARVRIDPDGLQFLDPNCELVLADVFVDDPHKSDMIACNDLIPFKPMSDLTLRGAIISDKPRKSLEASVMIGDCTAQLRARGARTWIHDEKWQMTDSDPVDRVELSWTRAAGGRVIGHPDGEVDARNPIGPGVLHKDYTPTNLEFEAPQIDSGAAPVGKTPFRSVVPQGFGLVPPWWESRSAFVGTYDDDWKENVHPRLPVDFDYRHYQVAPPELQLDHYLEPGMTITVDGMRPEGRFSMSIPDMVPFATYNFSDGRTIEVRLNLDGCHLDMSGETVRFDLTWRAWVELCPSFSHIDLNVERSAALEGRGVLKSTEDGVAQP